MTAKEDKVLQGMKLVLEGFKEKYGIDPTDANFKETPERVTRMYDEYFRGSLESEDKVKEILDKAFPCTYDEMVIVRRIRTHATCPHHLMPVEIECDVAYIPKKKSIGLSKLNRTVHLLARRLILQEQLTTDIADVLERHLAPKGVMVKIRGRHNCIRARGVKDLDSDTITSSVRGCFRDPLEKAREEFLLLTAQR
jgi:GTP cyclohydrolase I